ncbi:bifunctional non-homologous end joining protein LigD [Gillisia mitskevichiae]|uniref:Bifunctional non-homologous end joining protein LigD n=1 Tax=Gillisia mitskevichiae TaxID=270921 RepID=A0A495PUQ3_9FLAO|nr:non-homologous end-joining DNA ligase [Gillisia mitskevichiae]RKS53726.1 bifunctional non-homologous end joining protein LigD [Gillisia mitskevichiae]
MKKLEEKSTIWNIDGFELAISNPHKIYWPKENYTKLDLLNYYKQIAPILLPYLKNRPATMHFFPRGIEDFSFYKRNFEDKVQETRLFVTVPYNEISKDKIIQVLLIQNAAGILWLAARGGIEFHLWSAEAPNFDHPDIAIFDLDVADVLYFKNVLKAAGYLNELLLSYNLKGYPKTTGGTGLHIYVPIVPKYSFETVRGWVKSISDLLVEQYPKLVTTQRKKGKTHQKDKVTLDYMQNVISRNTAAPYTIRGYDMAPISTPLNWDEVKKGGFIPTDFTIKNVPERIKKLGDIFTEVIKLKQILPVGIGS